MIAGMLLVYFSGIADGLPKTNPSATSALCFVSVLVEVQWKAVSYTAFYTCTLLKAQNWMLIIGYSCGIGTIVAKLWRVYHIFR